MKTLILALVVAVSSVANARSLTRETGGMGEPLVEQYTCFNKIQLADGPEVAIVKAQASGFYVRLSFGMSGHTDYIPLDLVTENAQAAVYRERSDESLARLQEPSTYQTVEVVISNLASGGAKVTFSGTLVYTCDAK